MSLLFWALFVIWYESGLLLVVMCLVHLGLTILQLGIITAIGFNNRILEAVKIILVVGLISSIIFVIYYGSVILIGGLLGDS